ncbi:MAG: hypothetical protein AB7D39_14585 [Pseudodesulfovibrio sp.]|uniref:hypothetical protein n=1 Tax=Pseudodesulfovibrio sp. TaxID=2035812 RepID=UPI003D0CD5A5
MKRLLFTVLIILHITSIAHASAVEDLKQAQESASQVGETASEIWDYSREYGQAMDKHMQDVEKANIAAGSMALMMLASHLQFSVGTIEKTILLFLAFSEAPESVQGKQILYILNYQKQSIKGYREQISNLEDSYELMDEKGRKLCEKGVKQLDGAITDLNRALGWK